MSLKTTLVASLVLLFSLSPAATLAAKVAPKATVAKPKITVSKTVKAPTKVKAKNARVQLAEAVAIDKKGAIVSMSTAAVSVPTATCMKAVMKANVLCQKLGRGCASTSTTEKCKKANFQCETEQNAAQALCPQV